MDAEHVIDNVCSILEELGRPLESTKLVAALAQRGVGIDRESLNNLLYSPRHAREGLVRDGKLRWSFVRPKAPAPTGPSPDEGQLSLAEVEGLLDVLDFSWEGIRRTGTEPLLYFLEEADGEVRFIGPNGRVMVESAELFDAPEPCSSANFTPQQIRAAISLRVSETIAAAESQAREFLRLLAETEFLYPHSYHGPLVELVTDFIPVDADIRTALLVGGEFQLAMGPGAIQKPVYLVVDAPSGFRDSRYGVFRLCVYDLAKKGLVTIAPEVLNLTLRREADTVWIQGKTSRLALR